MAYFPPTAWRYRGAIVSICPSLRTEGTVDVIGVRCQVTCRKVSAGIRSGTGRDCRYGFLGLAKTCAKHGVAFWDYLGSRRKVPDQRVVPLLTDLVRYRGQPA